MLLQDFFFCQKSPILWVHPWASPSKTVVFYPQAIIALLCKTQKFALHTFGKEPNQVATPLSHQQIEWFLNNSYDWEIFLFATESEFDNHYPSNNLVAFLKMHPLIFPKIRVSQPVSKGYFFQMVLLKGQLWLCLVLSLRQPKLLQVLPKYLNL